MTAELYSGSDDEFHAPVDATDVQWAETCWFTFAVPQRRLSGQLYSYFKPALGVVAGAAYLWDDTGDQVWNCLYAKNFWHLPMPDGPLSRLRLANGMRLEVLDPGRSYAIGYDDPDGGGALNVDLTFTGVTPVHRLGEQHLDQPGWVEGEITLDGEAIAVNGYGFRDRTWGPRSQYGVGLHGTPCTRGGYSFATASAADAFFAITLDFGDGPAIVVHGYLTRDGITAPLVRGERVVLQRDRSSGAPTEVRLSATDDLGRTIEAVGVTLNRLGYLVNPNLWTWNCLTEWRWAGITAVGEDHDNWSVAGQREFSREFLAGRHSTGLAGRQ